MTLYLSLLDKKRCTNNQRTMHNTNDHTSFNNKTFRMNSYHVNPEGFFFFFNTLHDPPCNESNIPVDEEL